MTLTPHRTLKIPLIEDSHHEYLNFLSKVLTTRKNMARTSLYLPENKNIINPNRSLGTVLHLFSNDRH